MCVYVCVCACVRAGVRAPLANDSSETVEVSIVKLGTVTAAYMLMHHVFIILTLTFLDGVQLLDRRTRDSKN